jgi:ATP-dependent RNA helicase HelY
VLEVLEETSHLRGWQLTAAGVRLRRIYHECDLLVSIAVEEGLFDGLTDAELASLASCITYEHRSAEPPPAPELPTPRLRARFRSLQELSTRLAGRERRHHLPVTREPEGGFAMAAWAWASGLPLDDVLDEDMTGGDFVRNVRQLVDLLRQLAEVLPDEPARAAARRAAESLVRGVIVSAGEPG